MPSHSAVVVLFAVAGCASAPLPIAGTQDHPEDRAAILTTIDRFFEAMAARDQQAFTATTTGDGMVHSVVLREAETTLRARSMRGSSEQLARGSERLEETYWQPTVLQRGPLAVVWTPYRFRINGADSHWGVDAFTLVKADGEWRIASAAYTVEPEGGPELTPGPGASIRPASLR
ncbi:MAG: hypothetical protein WAT39_02440 [Planctomycetota bacterium]